MLTLKNGHLEMCHFRYMGYEFMQCQNSYIAFMRKCKWLIFIACT